MIYSRFEKTMPIHKEHSHWVPRIYIGYDNIKKTSSATQCSISPTINTELNAHTISEGNVEVKHVIFDFLL